MLTSAQTETTDSGVHSQPTELTRSQPVEDAGSFLRMKSDKADTTMTPMTDEEREQAAYRAGCAMQAWYSQYQLTGEPKYLDMAHEAMGLMRKLLAGRSAEQVARLEQERGLR